MIRIGKAWYPARWVPKCATLGCIDPHVRPGYDRLMNPALVCAAHDRTPVTP